MSVLRTIVSSSRALVTGAKDVARFREIAAVFVKHGFGWFIGQLKVRRELQIEFEYAGADLTRRAAHLKAVAPKLRAKGAGEAVEMFLTRDAMAPSALPLPDRAARRLCDRLVDLGAVRELTGRDTFRLYGV